MHTLIAFIYTQNIVRCYYRIKYYILYLQQNDLQIPSKILLFEDIVDVLFPLPIIESKEAL